MPVRFLSKDCPSLLWMGVDSISAEMRLHHNPDLELDPQLCALGIPICVVAHLLQVTLGQCTLNVTAKVSTYTNVTLERITAVFEYPGSKKRSDAPLHRC